MHPTQSAALTHLGVVGCGNPLRRHRPLLLPGYRCAATLDVGVKWTVSQGVFHSAVFGVSDPLKEARERHLHVLYEFAPRATAVLWLVRGTLKYCGLIYDGWLSGWLSLLKPSLFFYAASLFVVYRNTSDSCVQQGLRQHNSAQSMSHIPVPTTAVDAC